MIIKKEDALRFIELIKNKEFNEETYHLAKKCYILSDESTQELDDALLEQLFEAKEVYHDMFSVL